MSDDLSLSLRKWEAFYARLLKNQMYLSEYKKYKEMYYHDTYRQVMAVSPKTRPVYLEIGSGTFFFGQLLAKDCRLVIGIDICRNALLIARKMLKKKKIHNYLLVQGDILNMPFADNSVDLVYGGGVIEHFKNTADAIRELQRVLRPGGVSFNTVPYLNVGSLTYRQVWGNIPNIPVLKSLFELIHIKLLGARHMTYGYEQSFLRSTLEKMHRQAGFRKVQVEKFDVTLYFEFIPQSMRRTFRWLAQTSPLFWPMVKIIALK